MAPCGHDERTRSRDKVLSLQAVICGFARLLGQRRLHRSVMPAERTAAVAADIRRLRVVHGRPPRRHRCLVVGGQRVSAPDAECIGAQLLQRASRASLDPPWLGAQERPLSYSSGARESDSAHRQTADGCQLPAAQVGEPVGEVEDQVAPLVGQCHSREPFAIPLLALDREI